MTILLHLAGAVMLLLWAVRMVRTGVERAHGHALKGALREARGRTVAMALSGVLLAILLQSSTAVGLLAAGFASTGIVTVATGIAALLGADLGSALVVKILSFDLSGLIPLLLLAGGAMFLRFERRSIRQNGRIVLGVAFILISLKMVGEATEPLRDSPVLPVVIGYLGNDPVTAFAVAALLTWVAHSSVATMLLFVTFAGMGILPANVAVPLVLGANVGGAVIAVWLTRGMERNARRIPIGNLVFRGAGSLAAFLAFLALPLPVPPGEPISGHALVNLHLLFNLALALIALPLTGPVARLTAVILPEPPAPAGEALNQLPASLLDRATLAAPSLGFASAKRELLHMGEIVETMFRPVIDILDVGNPAEIARIRGLDAEVNRRHTDIKLFIAEMRRGGLPEDAVREGIELTDFAINLEHIGDLVSKVLMGLAEKKANRNLRFSPEGWAEITGLHARVLSNMQTALNVLVSGDVESARALAREKEEMRRLERRSHERHLARLQSGNAESIESSDMHLETVRALKEINSLLVTVAYPILSESGHLLESRLVQPA